MIIHADKPATRGVARSVWAIQTEGRRHEHDRTVSRPVHFLNGGPSRQLVAGQ